MIAFRPKTPGAVLHPFETARGEVSPDSRSTDSEHGGDTQQAAPEHDDQCGKATCTCERLYPPAEPVQSAPEADHERHTVEADPEQDNWEPLADQPVWVTPSASFHDFFLSTQHTTFGYQQAMNNRINENALKMGGRFDPEEMLPIFLYDTLQLPGTLSYILGLESSSHILPSMTPGTLGGFHTSVEEDTKLPLLWPARFEDDFVQGMVVFGRSQKDRHILEQEHFGAGFKIQQAEVKVRLSGENIKMVMACFWVRDYADGENPGVAEDWTLDRFIAGNITGFTPFQW